MTGLLLLAGLAALFIWGIKGSMERQHVLKNTKAIKTLLMGYGLVLAASLFVFETLPKKEDKFANAGTDSQLEKEAVRIHDALYNGRLDEVDPQYALKQWEWEYSGKNLRIETDEWWLGGPVIVESKPENDGKIEGTYYGGLVFEGIDFTDRQPARDVRLERDTLKLISTVEERRFNFAIFEKEFLITQFTGENRSRDFSGFHEIDYLYLKIPKDLQLKPIGDETFIHFVGEGE